MIITIKHNVDYNTNVDLIKYLNSYRYFRDWQTYLGYPSHANLKC